MIEPIEAELASHNIKTLVFIPDGALRNLPMSIIHDGEQYLIEKYSVAVAPSLQLIDPQPLVKGEQKFSALTAGVSEARPHRPEFDALPAVEMELEEINSYIPSLVLLNNFFSESTSIK